MIVERTNDVLMLHQLPVPQHKETIKFSVNDLITKFMLLNT